MDVLNIINKRLIPLKNRIERVKISHLIRAESFIDLFLSFLYQTWQSIVWDYSV